ncbi:MAG: MTH1187 family thiamine-binding protein [Candidatus Thermoplasmatota archaeon]|nr:MTH1187 family thiamine-binding protein [Candidatus Thermoplasmatota archaeon]
MIIAELAIFPISEGTSVSKYVREALKALEKTGLKYESGAMSTCIESPDLESIFDAVEKAHDAIVKMGAKRIQIALSIDHRLDKDATMESKLKAIGKGKA